MLHTEKYIIFYFIMLYYFDQVYYRQGLWWFPCQRHIIILCISGSLRGISYKSYYYALTGKTFLVQLMSIHNIHGQRCFLQSQIILSHRRALIAASHSAKSCTNLPANTDAQGKAGYKVTRGQKLQAPFIRMRSTFTE